jgi:hypothetical protein
LKIICVLKLNVKFTLLLTNRLRIFTDFPIVRELMGWVCNVVLIKCILDLGKPKKGWDFGREGTWAG